MRHATEGQLRRLEDEPLAVADRVVEHLDGCSACRGDLDSARRDSQRCARHFGGPRAVPNLDAAWARFTMQQRVEAARPRRHLTSAGRTSAEVSVPRRVGRLAGVSMRSALVAGGVAVVLAGTAAAATVTTVLSPTHVAAVPLSKSDIATLAEFMGMTPMHSSCQAGTSCSAHGSTGDSVGSGTSTQPGNGIPMLGGFTSPSGTITTKYGTVEWSSSGQAQRVSTLAAAEQAAGFDIAVPTTLPSGVSGATNYIVQPHVQATITLDQGIAEVGGATVVIDAGPAVLVTYGSVGGEGMPTLGILTMPRPQATVSGASLSQIEAYLLTRGGLPSDLAQEVRLLGNLATTLPVPIPPKAVESSVTVNGSP
ncbi:MAG: hypothetical protein ACRDYC_00930, partial [Acidimicrobiales bacterium]